VRNAMFVNESDTTSYLLSNMISGGISKSPKQIIRIIVLIELLLG
jgi:hypothetical protein